MSTTLEQPAVQPRPARPRRQRSKSGAMTLLAQGEPMIWLTCGALVLAVVMILSLLTLVVVNAAGTFWPTRLSLVTTVDGRQILGEVTRSESYVPAENAFDILPESDRQAAKATVAADGKVRRRLLRTGNFELTNEHFTWVSEFEIKSEERPEWAVIFERRAWGRFYGMPKEFLVDGRAVATDPAAAWEKFEEFLPGALERFGSVVSLTKHDLGKLNAQEEKARLAIKDAELDYGEHSDEAKARRADFDELQAKLTEERATITQEIEKLNAENERYAIVVATTKLDPAANSSMEQTIPLSTVVRAYPANQLTLGERLGVYFSRWWEFVWDMPREANTEGGVFPAIWGTVTMTLIMSLAVVPFGVLAALYLKEYAKAGPVVSAVRIAINNLAGVPSIVFGVFGLGFFCYIIGGYIDGGPERVGISPWPQPTWFFAVGLLTVCGVGAFLLGVYNLSVRKAEMSRRRRIIGYVSLALWIATAVLLVLIVARLPFFDGFYAAKLADNNPTFGKGALLWASLTLALLTLPVVIVATEEALSAVPNSMREGSYACGASKWQTIRRIVLPRAMPGIMTGMILAMARGAGEVAPLMLVGAVKVAPELPVNFLDWGGEMGPLPTGPVHLDRSFLHLGFHIYDVGFQSQNSEAAIPLVYTTTLLLIGIIASLNIFAVMLRARLRRRFVVGQF